MRSTHLFCGKRIVPLVSISILTLLLVYSFNGVADTPLVIYGHVRYDDHAISNFEVEATNERTEDTMTAQVDDGIYTVTFGGPIHEWKIGDTITLKAQGKGSYACLRGEKSITVTSDDPIQVDIPLHLSINADFAFTPENPKAEDNVSFTDISTGTITNHTWNFGDGNTSYEQNPVHAYASEGNYTVVLTIYCHTFSTSASSLLHVEKQEANDTDNSNETNGTGSTPSFLLPPTIAAMCVLLAIFKRRRHI